MSNLYIINEEGFDDSFTCEFELYPFGESCDQRFTCAIVNPDADDLHEGHFCEDHILIVQERLGITDES